VDTTLKCLLQASNSDIDSDRVKRKGIGISHWTCPELDIMRRETKVSDKVPSSRVNLPLIYSLFDERTG